MIRRYHWPGNVRELSNAIERAVILCEDDDITPDLLAIDHRVTGASTAADLSDRLSLEEYFRYSSLEAPGKHDRDRTRPGTGDQPQDPLGTPSALDGLPRPKKAQLNGGRRARPEKLFSFYRWKHQRYVW